MNNNSPIGGSVFLNADTGETIITPYTQEQIDEMISVGLIKDASEVNN
jgi:hypothetical protein